MDKHDYPDAEAQENVYSKLVIMILNKRKGTKAQRTLLIQIMTTIR